MSSLLLAQATVESSEIFAMLGFFGIMVLIAGFYSVMVTSNLIRTVISLEILTKAVTLLIIGVGYLTGQIGLAQALVITLIVIEVALTVVAVGVILCLFRHERSIDAATVRKLKG
jgi:multicomponent Na+:H+ antiporter subunit C